MLRIKLPYPNVEKKTPPESTANQSGMLDVSAAKSRPRVRRNKSETPLSMKPKSASLSDTASMPSVVTEPTLLQHQQQQPAASKKGKKVRRKTLKKKTRKSLPANLQSRLNGKEGPKDDAKDEESSDVEEESSSTETDNKSKSVTANRSPSSSSTGSASSGSIASTTATTSTSSLSASSPAFTSISAPNSSLSVSSASSDAPLPIVPPVDGAEDQLLSPKRKGGSVIKKKKKKKNTMTPTRLQLQLEAARVAEKTALKKYETERNLRDVAEKMVSKMLSLRPDQALEEALAKWKDAEERIIHLRNENEELKAALREAQNSSETRK